MVNVGTLCNRNAISELDSAPVGTGSTFAISAFATSACFIGPMDAIMEVVDAIKEEIRRRRTQASLTEKEVVSSSLLVLDQLNCVRGTFFRIILIVLVD
mmetsp:Transcript_6448/g.9436  ORF Transcript_6448/g.9436 Transcript_6448/m.9436 type:complete len:99 (+) Transcript_6448:87-383(+)